MIAVLGGAVGPVAFKSLRAIRASSQRITLGFHDRCGYIVDPWTSAPTANATAKWRIQGAPKMSSGGPALADVAAGPNALDRAHLGDIEGALGTVQSFETGPRLSLRRKLGALLAISGPGIVVMVADNDSGTFSVFAQAGQDHGTSLLWVLLLLCPALYVVQEMVAAILAMSTTLTITTVLPHLEFWLALLATCALLLTVAIALGASMVLSRRRQSLSSTLPHPAPAAGHSLAALALVRGYVLLITGLLALKLVGLVPV